MSERGVSVPAELEAVIFRCLAKQPEDRYSDASALQADLDSCAKAVPWRTPV